MAAAALLVILVASQVSGASRAQDSDAGIATTGDGAEIPANATFDRENILKAAFVMNFARYTTWPPPAADNRFHVCVVGQGAVGDALRLLEGEPVKGRPVAVSAVADYTAFASCQMLFISESEADKAKGILAAVDGKPVLTVSDLPKFTQAGGVIGLKIVDNRIRFDVNAQVARRVGLHLSAQLLRLAEYVTGDQGEGE